MLANFASVRVEGAANLPASGGAVIVCNHTDLSDGLIQLLYTPRPLVFLAKSELFESGGNLRISDIIEGNEFFRQFPSDILADMMNLAGQFIQDVDAMPVIRGYRGNWQPTSAKNVISWPATA
ncbi:MAG TPA: 1-acyl-sn-glycerol-3-phosphate acyltransferase, partial [Leptospiraceae bacterium]|nr:1-acyl-sn-glycerol-3-phosphate acyltransferase [Leptospiraceae bacterium]